ncbi:hypothetical protein M9H77_03082 [Catharanthus roseus]|uniref:Uncharacterized protein n=1 Tax=Catharanthus roseus TaxID=4058 RepID=A0ACC0CAN4_CATRO|nr:hypothetical protein M9H77_03082 [Catharanthus roseus]
MAGQPNIDDRCQEWPRKILDYSQGCLELKKEKTGRDTIRIPTSTSRSGGLSRTFLGETIVNIQHTMTLHLYLLLKYIDSANAEVKIMEAVLRSQMASFQNMENHIELKPILSQRIIEELLSHITRNTITLQDVEEQVMTFPMFMDDDDETAQEPEEFTFPEEEDVQQEIMEMRQDDLLSFEEPPQITSEAEESKRDECLPENKKEC